MFPRKIVNPFREAKVIYAHNMRSGKVYIPPQFRDKVLYWFHAGAYGGHNGVKTYPSWLATLHMVALFLHKRKLNTSPHVCCANGTSVKETAVPCTPLCAREP